MTYRPRLDATRRPARRHVSLAREHRATFRGEALGPDTGASPVAETDERDERNERVGPPLGLPVLSELPELAEALAALADADRLVVTGVLALSRLLDADADAVLDATGVGLEHWIALTGASPRLERRTWLRTARLLQRLPGLRGQVETGRVSAGQLRGLTIALRGAPTAIDSELDGWLSDAAGRLAELGADPDALVDQARQAVVELTDQIDQTEAEENRARFLHLQPKLDGTGGTFTGAEDAYGFAVLEAVTRLRPGQPHTVADRARADNLQAALHGIPPCAHTDEPGDSIAADVAAGDGVAADVATGVGVVAHGAAGSHEVDGPVTSAVTSAVDELAPEFMPGGWLGARLNGAAWADAHQQHLADAPELAERIAGYARSGGFAPPKLLVRAELDTLVGGHVPSELLVQLAGGKLRMTSQATRRLIAAHGAKLRLIITDQGKVVGVGRATRRPPEWLTDVQAAIHDTCTGPLCDRPALGADVDHADAWHPEGDKPGGGRTEADNLGPLCRGTNRNRGATGWRPEQHGSDGIRTWRHARTGLATTSIPATWRPPNRRPPPTATCSGGDDGDDGDPDSGEQVRGDANRDHDLPF